MSKGMRLRLVLQGVMLAKIDVKSFVEYGDDEEHVEKIPYDPNALKAIVNSGLLQM